MQSLRSMIVALALGALLGEAAAGQGVTSVLMLDSPSSSVSGSFAGEMTLMTDTLVFRVESGTIRNGHNSRVAVGSVSLALREVDADGTWRIAHRGYDYPVEAGLRPEEEFEVAELMLGLTVPGLLSFTELRPMVVITLLAPSHAAEGWAFLNQTMGELFNLRGPF